MAIVSAIMDFVGIMSFAIVETLSTLILNAEESFCEHLLADADWYVRACVTYDRRHSWR
jgi:hypothetical protein